MKTHLKEQVTEYLKNHSKKEAAKHFNIGINTINRWTNPVYEKKHKDYAKKNKKKIYKQIKKWRGENPEYMKQWLKDNAEHVEEYRNDSKTKVKRAEYAKQYAKDNPEIISKINEKWRSKPEVKENRKQYNKEYYQKNREKFQQHNAEYYEVNRQSILDYQKGRSHPTQEWRFTAEYKSWRKDVYSRDDYTCQYCGSQTKLHAHHIKEANEYIDLRYDINNGVTLCKQCHKKEHSI